MKLVLVVVGLSLLGAALGAARAADKLPVRRARSAPAGGLQQILVAGDGQPEDIGYGYQRNVARTSRPSFQGLLLLDKSGWPDTLEQAAPLQLKRTLTDDEDAAGNSVAVTSAFRERLASRQRRQREQQQQQQQQQHWNDWQRDYPSVASFYPAGSPETVDNPERYLQALREAWARYQQQTGTIDVGPDDLTDLETLQFLEALGEDIPGPGTRKRSVSNLAMPAGNRQQGPASGATPWDWAAPLAWSGYQVRKRSATPDFQEDPSEWSDEAAVAMPSELVQDDDDLDDGEEGVVGGTAGSGSRLAMLLTQQLFDERYNDPAVKRLLLTKRSLSQEDPAGLDPSGLPPGHAMRRRKKSTRPARTTATGTAANVQKDLAHIFGEPEPVEPPRALPLSDSAAPTAAPSNQSGAGHAMNPIGHAHETDKLAREHNAHAAHDKHDGHGAAHASSTASPQTVTVHEEHAPPMVAAEGPHSHDQAVHAEDKDKEAVAGKGGEGKTEPGAGTTPAHSGLREEPRALELRQELRQELQQAQTPLRIAKKSIDWSQYFGLDRRRKKSTSLNDVDQIDADWLLRHNLMAFAKSPKPSNINKRVAVKKEGASPDALLLGSWGGRSHAAWDADESSGAEDGDDYSGWDATNEVGRCPAVTRLAEDCRGAVGSNDALLPLCVLYQACHLCGAAMGVPVRESCETELGRRGADLCLGAGESDSNCRSAVEAIVEVYRSRHATDSETCTKQPCLAHFFLTAPAVAFAR